MLDSILESLCPIDVSQSLWFTPNFIISWILNSHSRRRRREADLSSRSISRIFWFISLFCLPAAAVSSSYPKFTAARRRSLEALYQVNGKVNPIKDHCEAHARGSLEIIINRGSLSTFHDDPSAIVRLLLKRGRDELGHGGKPNGKWFPSLLPEGCCSTEWRLSPSARHWSYSVPYLSK